MIDISDEQFGDLIGEALDELPQERVQRLLKDVAVTWEYDPTPEQRQKLQLRNDQTLYGLYEGVPLTKRYSAGYSGTGQLPDKITIFKGPITARAHDAASLKEQIKKTVWHEMAHFFGLDHPRIHELGG
jgi:predicted Zn-dependent protease with MMP-like domain